MFSRSCSIVTVLLVALTLRSKSELLYFRQLIVLVAYYYTGNSQPIPKTGWEVVNVASVRAAGYPYARVALFSNGGYIVVYPIVDVSTNSSIAAQIFSPTGTSIYGEFKVSGSGVFTAPNVIVFSDNT